MREEVTGDNRKFCNEELHDLYSFQNIILVIKSRRMKWVEHVPWKGGNENRTQSFGVQT